MHELGLVFEVLNREKGAVEENQIEPQQVAAVVLDVGEASTVVPKYMKECWPAAVDRTEYEHVDLKINELTAVVECKQCGNLYEYLNNDRKCPKCGCEKAALVTGKEFQLKEILLYDD